MSGCADDFGVGSPKWETSSDLAAASDGQLTLTDTGLPKCPFCEETFDIPDGTVIHHDCPFIPHGWEKP